MVQSFNTQAKETINIKLTKSSESFSLDMPLQLEDGEWMLGLTSLEVYNSTSNITKDFKFGISKLIEKRNVILSIQNEVMKIFVQKTLKMRR